MKRIILCTSLLITSLITYSQSNYKSIVQLPDTSTMQIVSSVAFTLKDTVYFGTGYTTGNVDQSYIYKSRNQFESWERIADIPGNPRNNAMSFVINDTAYVIGGSNGNARLKDGYKYNPSINQWFPIVDFPVSSGIYGAVAVSIDSVAYIASGSIDNSLSANIYKYSPVTNNYTVMTTIPGLTRVYTEGFAIENKFYIFGGANGSSRLSDMYIYNPEDTSCTKLNDLPSGMLFGSSFAIGNKGYVIGGRNSSELNSNDIWEYTPENDSWEILKDTIPENKFLQFSTTLNRRAYFGGGLDKNDNASKEFFEFYPYDSVYVFDTICNGDSVLLSGKYQKNAGIFSDTLLNSSLQDSIVVTELTVTPVYKFTSNEELCTGDSILWQNTYYKETGNYNKTYSTEYTCDSTYILNLVINPTYSFKDSLSICAGDSILWQNKYYKIAGDFFASYKTAKDCDSIYKLILDVNNLPQFTLGKDTTIKTGSTIILAPDSDFESYLWDDNSNTKQREIIADNYMTGKNSFWLKVSNESDCSITDTIIITIEKLSSVHSIEQQVIVKTYPNPTKKFLYLEVTAPNPETLKISVFNAEGKTMNSTLIYSNNKQKIDISSYPAGLYILSVKTTKTEKVIRFIKE